MDEIRTALEIELDRLRTLVAKYRPRIPAEVPADLAKEGPLHRPAVCLCATHLGDTVDCPLALTNKAERVRDLTNIDPHVRTYTPEASTTNFPVLRNTYSYRHLPPSRQRSHSRPRFYQQQLFSYEHKSPTIMSSQELMDLSERRQFIESFLRLHEFYRKNYPLDSELVTELRALRATYEQTGGANKALKAALDKTLDEALKVETERRLGLADLDWYERNSVHYPRRWDYSTPYFDRDYRWERAVHANEIERANHESQLIGDQLRRMREKQEDRVRQRSRSDEAVDAPTT